jgi:predicted nuclease of predicted toxin-antitoxin system
VRLWFDEDLSPTLVQVAEGQGFEATCNRDRGMLGCKDHQLRHVTQAEDYVLVTDNASDFRPMFARDAIHPGLVVMPGTVGRDAQKALLGAAIGYIVDLARDAGEEPADFMVNKLVEIDADGTCSAQELPPA